MSYEPFVGEIMLFSGSYAPEGWADCDGRLIPITDNQVLFSILGNSYGGDGLRTFGLPDLRGRTAVGVGREVGGHEVYLGKGRHSQEVMVGLGDGLKRKIAELDASVRKAIDELDKLKKDPPADTPNAATAAANPDDYLSPHTQERVLEEGDLGLRYCIALRGIYPPRS